MLRELMPDIIAQKLHKSFARVQIRSQRPVIWYEKVVLEEFLLF